MKTQYAVYSSDDDGRIIGQPKGFTVVNGGDNARARRKAVRQIVSQDYGWHVALAMPVTEVAKVLAKMRRDILIWEKGL